MLRVTVEFIPNGNESMKHTLGVMHIGRIALDMERQMGEYHIAEMTPDPQSCGNYTVKNVPRGTNMPIFDFLQKIFLELSKQV